MEKLSKLLNSLNLFKTRNQTNTKVEEPKRIEVVDYFDTGDPALIYIDNNHFAVGTINYHSIDRSVIAINCGDDDCDIVWGNPTNTFVKGIELWEFETMNITSITLYEDNDNDLLFDNVCILKAIDGKHKLMVQYKEPEFTSFIDNNITVRRFSTCGHI